MKSGRDLSSCRALTSGAFSLFVLSILAKFSFKNRNVRKYTNANLIVKYSQVRNKDISQDREAPISLSCTVVSCKIIEKKNLIVLRRLCNNFVHCVVLSCRLSLQ